MHTLVKCAENSFNSYYCIRFHIIAPLTRSIGNFQFLLLYSKTLFFNLLELLKYFQFLLLYSSFSIKSVNSAIYSALSILIIVFFVCKGGSAGLQWKQLSILIIVFLYVLLSICSLEPSIFQFLLLYSSLIPIPEVCLILKSFNSYYCILFLFFLIRAFIANPAFNSYYCIHIIVVPFPRDIVLYFQFLLLYSLRLRSR